MNSQLCLRLFAAGLALAAVSGPASAQETKTYTYDVLGRLKEVVVTGGPSSGTNVSYEHDKADNRTNVTVSSSPNGNGPGDDPNSNANVRERGFVVVPLNGYSLIFHN